MWASNGGRPRIRYICVSHLYGLFTTNPPILCDFNAIQPPASNPHTPVKFSQITPNGQIAGSRILPWGPPHGFSQQAVKSTDSHSFTDVPIFHGVPPHPISQKLTICEFCGISFINIFYRSCFFVVVCVGVVGSRVACCFWRSCVFRSCLLLCVCCFLRACCCAALSSGARVVAVRGFYFKQASTSCAEREGKGLCGL